MNNNHKNKHCLGQTLLPHHLVHLLIFERLSRSCHCPCRCHLQWSELPLCWNRTQTIQFRLPHDILFQRHEQHDRLYAIYRIFEFFCLYRIQFRSMQEIAALISYLFYYTSISVAHSIFFMPVNVNSIAQRGTKGYIFIRPKGWKGLHATICRMKVFFRLVSDENSLGYVNRICTSLTPMKMLIRVISTDDLLTIKVLI